MAKSISTRSAKSKKKSPARKTAKRTTSTKAAAGKKKVEVDRRKSVPKAKEGDRRDADRRQKSEPVAVERRKLVRREKVNRRRQIDPTTCEREYSDAEVEFMNALELYKRKNGRMFPTCSEILEVIVSLGYQKPGINATADLPAASSTDNSSTDNNSTDNNSTDNNFADNNPAADAELETPPTPE